MIRISDIAVPISDARPLEALVAERLSMPQDAVRRVSVVRRAVDARRRHGAPICFSYVMDVETEESERRILGRFRRDKKIAVAPDAEPSIFMRLAEKKTHALSRRPIVVGFGPAGMFAALALSTAGCAPLVLERGRDVDARHAEIERFWSGGVLDGDTNVQFGEGGAGTFSDGKLTARGGDPLQRDIIDAFIRAGAPEEIRYLAKPHIGTDRLRGVVKAIREEIRRLGGEVRFGARVEELEIDAAGVQSVRLAGGDYRAPVQSVGDFLRGTAGSRDFCVAPTYRPGVAPCRFDDCLPPFVVRTLRDSLPAFDKKIHGFAAADVPMTSVETRSSAPCRILRDRDTFVSVSAAGLYPIGEGAGYAGGIMSAAVDGLKAALAFLRQNDKI